MLPSVMRPKRLAAAAGLALGAALLPAATDLLPERMSEVSRAGRGGPRAQVRAARPGDRDRHGGARSVLRAKIGEGFPAPVDEALRSLVVLGLIDETPRLLDHLIDFYASQVIAFYDPEPRRFFVVKDSPGMKVEGLEMAGMAETLIFSHELTHALQDETLRLDSRIKDLKEDSDRGLALQCLLEGEATLVMIQVVLQSLPGAGEDVEEELAPLLSAGASSAATSPRTSPTTSSTSSSSRTRREPRTSAPPSRRAAGPRSTASGRTRPSRAPRSSTARPTRRPSRACCPSNVATLLPGRLIYTDTLGEWTLRFLLGRALPEDEAGKAATGWRGDRIAFFATPGGGMGYLWHIRFDDGLSSARFENALKKARAKRPVAGAEVVQRAGRDVVVANGLAEGAGALTDPQAAEDRRDALGHLDPVLPRPLRAVERLVRHRDEGLRRGRVPGRRGRDTQADRHDPRGRARVAGGHALDAQAQDLGDGGGAAGGRRRQNRRELLAAVARDEVARARQRLADLAGHAPQALVADLVAERVVEVLEVVDVDHDERERQPVAGRAPPLARQRLLEPAAVRDAGQRVDLRELLEPGVGLLELQRALGHDLLELPLARLRPRGPHARGAEAREHQPDRAQPVEPGRLAEMRPQREARDRVGVAPDAVVVARP